MLRARRAPRLRVIAYATGWLLLLSSGLLLAAALFYWAQGWRYGPAIAWLGGGCLLPVAGLGVAMAVRRRALGSAAGALLAGTGGLLLLLFHFFVADEEGLLLPVAGALALALVLGTIAAHSRRASRGGDD